jgi:hypothetical protein
MTTPQLPFRFTFHIQSFLLRKHHDFRCNHGSKIGLLMSIERLVFLLLLFRRVFNLTSGNRPPRSHNRHCYSSVDSIPHHASLSQSLRHSWEISMRVQPV